MLLGSIGVLSLAAAVLVCCFGGGEGLALLWIGPLSFAASFLALGLLAFAFLWLVTAFVKLDVPQERDSKFYRRLTYLYVDAICTILRMRLHTQGLEKTPTGGRFLLVWSHLCDLDPVVLLGWFKKSQLAFISKWENSSMFIVGKLMHKLMCQLINRENDREALKTILRCIQLLKEDQVSVAVFPEGYTSRDGKLHKFRPGVFKIAMKAQVPIVVCTVTNTNRVFHNILRLKPTDVTLHLVDVIPPEALKGRTAVDVSDQVYNMMLADLGPEFALEEAENGETSD